MTFYSVSGARDKSRIRLEFPTLTEAFDFMRDYAKKGWKMTDPVPVTKEAWERDEPTIVTRRGT